MTTAPLYPQPEGPAIYLTSSGTAASAPLYWLAEQAVPPGMATKHDDGPQHDIFVTTGDTVGLADDAEGVIVGNEGLAPRVQITKGSGWRRAYRAGDVVTIDPDDIVAALIVQRLMAGA